ncbi:hypothetical protein [Pengzhenrongella sp.]|jgi:hypothetical protein|uniref:hypothetical protein n=1 Tax=Pengzhenrongella sp. TaxID=2888820 RepID=UPI002F95575A
MRRSTGLGLVTIALAGACYVKVGRPWQLTWGATPEEVARPFAGDELIPAPTFNATRAITISAPPERIWPWLVQVGTTRAGWYGYDLLDNLGHASARHLLPEHQHLAVGDVVPMSPDGLQGMSVHSFEAPHSLIWSTPGDTSWAWRLDAQTDGTTRVTTRIRSRIRWSPMSIAYYALVEIADVWMIRKMLLNLKARAETVAPAC